MNKYLIKISEQLKPHQNRALKKLEKNDGVILDHSMGSGKTVTFLTAVERDQKKNKNSNTLIVAPASLQTNIEKEIKKHKLNIDMSKIEVMSYEKATNDEARLKKNKYTLAIADEAHRLRNPGTQRHTHLSEIIASADKRLLATGTTSYNHISDTAPLINIAAGGYKVLPEGKKAFEEQYVAKHKEAPPLLQRILGAPSKEISSLKNKADLKHRLNLYMDSYDNRSDPEAAKHFPTTSEKKIEVEMSPEQIQLYKFMENKLPWHLKLKVRSGMPLDKKESSQLNAFSSGIRQVSNSTKSFMPQYIETTPKIRMAADSIQKGIEEDKNFKGLVYSNYLSSGLRDYSEELSKRGIPHGVYTGELSKKEKDDMIRDYNSGKNKVLLVSSSGSEGLDLKGTKKVQVMEPHFNRSKIDQVVARAARYDSHKDLPTKERHVEIEHYHSVFPKNWFGKRPTSIDTYLHDNSQHKNSLTEQMKELTKND